MINIGTFSCVYWTYTSACMLLLLTCLPADIHARVLGRGAWGAEQLRRMGSPALYRGARPTTLGTNATASVAVPTKGRY